MCAELAKVYSPREVEGAVYQKWLKAGAFHADEAAGGKTYTIVIPPPNVTAALHLGHALNNTLQDVLIRQRRMAGYNTLWMPGTDHAGIATQTVVDKRLRADGQPGLERYRKLEEAGRDGRGQFIAKVQSWKDEYEARIIGQLRAMGCSCDWERTRFTMDEVCARAVRAAFFKLFSDGLIYRGKRLVNWDPATQTVLADDEVEHETVQGSFYYLRYPLVAAVVVNGVAIEHVTVATTRPETMLGDTAVAMNPADPRAAALVGRKVRLPIVGREIPIIADEHVVLPNPESEDVKAKFSTGFLKVTPAHDPEDWQIGQRHGLPVINVLAPDGSISEQHGWSDWDQVKNADVENLIGLDRFEARAAVVEFFRQEGLLEDVKPYVHEVGHSYRSHVPIEPYLSDQWFVAVKKPIANERGGSPEPPRRGGSGDPPRDDEGVAVIPGTDVPGNSLAGLALKPLLDGELRFVPERYAGNYRSWLENLRDWPISRQLWWGHRIPVWSQDLKLPTDVTRGPVNGHQNDARVVAALNRAVGGDFDKDFHKFPVRYMLVMPDEAHEEGSVHTHLCLDRDDPGCIKWLEKSGWVRDPDVLDTWFSSALWPISTMGWPEETATLKTFYPTDVLCTAREIITLWVSRMVMFGEYFRGQSPFHDVYIHAMIQDGEGRKMSKSLGNGIDPLDIIASHGADAMRFTLAYMTTETQDVRMPVEAMTLPDGRKVNSSPKFDLGRNFCTKLWNSARFAMMNLEAAPPWGELSTSRHLSDRWILSRLTRTIRDVTMALEGYQFHDAAEVLYRYMWNDFCDWYLEIAKVRLAGGDLAPKAVLAYGLDVLLRLLHPIMPFITEQIWEMLNQAAPNRGPDDSPGEPLLMRAAWPTPRADWMSDVDEARFGVLMQIIGGIREVRSRYNVPTTRKVRVTVAAAGEDARLVQENAELIQSLALVEEVKIDASVRPGSTDGTVVAGAVTALIHEVIDPAAELARLAKRKETLAKGVAGAEAKLNNPKFLEKAKPELVAKERERLAGMREELSSVEKSLAALG